MKTWLCTGQNNSLDHHYDNELCNCCVARVTYSPHARLYLTASARHFICLTFLPFFKSFVVRPPNFTLAYDAVDIRHRVETYRLDQAQGIGASGTLHAVAWSTTSSARLIEDRSCTNVNNSFACRRGMIAS